MSKSAYSTKIYVKNNLKSITIMTQNFNQNVAQGATAQAAQVAENQNTQIAKKSAATETVYYSGDNKITLTKQIVRDFLTKGMATVSDQDIVQFIGICSYNHLNPFLGEAQLIKYSSTAPAQMIVTKEAFYKRAEANEHYKGIQAGIIVLRGDKVLELEGAFMLHDDVLLGGWAKVFRDDRDTPIIAKVMLSEYNTNQSTWKSKPATMICKVAKVQALREAFPSQLGAMYTEDEISADSKQEAQAGIAEEVKENANQGQPLEIKVEAEQPTTAVEEKKDNLF
jgi:phage recombination protein Bet